MLSYVILHYIVKTSAEFDLAKSWTRPYSISFCWLRGAQVERSRREHDTQPRDIVRALGSSCYGEGSRNYGAASENWSNSAFNFAQVTRLINFNCALTSDRRYWYGISVYRQFIGLSVVFCPGIQCSYRVETIIRYISSNLLNNPVRPHVSFLSPNSVTKCRV